MRPALLFDGHSVHGLRQLTYKHRPRFSGLFGYSNNNSNLSVFVIDGVKGFKECI